MSKDLGEIGDLNIIILGGVIPESGVGSSVSRNVVATYWGRYLGVVSPATIGDFVAIGQDTISHGARLSVGGDIFATGFILSDTVRVTKDEDDNLVFTDPVSGSKTLAQIIAAAGGDVLVSGTPVNTELAEWIDATHIRGIAKSALTLTQSQITGLVTALTNKASLTHNLIDTTRHPVTGLTTGHFLKALSPTSYGFAAHGLNATAIGLGNVTNNAQVKKIASATNLAIARWNGTTGDLLKDSSATLDDIGNINIPTGAKYKVNGVPISLYGVAAFHNVTFSDPLELDGVTYKDFKCASITGNTTINLNGVIDGEAGMIELIIDATGGYTIALGTMFTKQLGDVDIDTTADMDNFISWRKVGADIVYTIAQEGAISGFPVTKTGTPVANQVAVWSADGVIKGDAALTFDTTTDTLTSAIFVGALTGNATTVTTNANLTGVVTSTGNATVIADAALSIGKTSGLQTALDLKASLASPVFTTPIRLKGYTVATLPAGTQGDKAFVSDALAPTYLVTVVGGGAVVTEVFFNGTNWVCT